MPSLGASFGMDGCTYRLVRRSCFRLRGGLRGRDPLFSIGQSGPRGMEPAPNDPPHRDSLAATHPPQPARHDVPVATRPSPLSAVAGYMVHANTHEQQPARPLCRASCFPLLKRRLQNSQAQKTAQRHPQEHQALPFLASHLHEVATFHFGYSLLLARTRSRHNQILGQSPS